jgi:hypothetical protein
MSEPETTKLRKMGRCRDCRYWKKNVAGDLGRCTPFLETRAAHEHCDIWERMPVVDQKPAGGGGK